VFNVLGSSKYSRAGKEIMLEAASRDDLPGIPVPNDKDECSAFSWMQIEAVR